MSVHKYLLRVPEDLWAELSRAASLNRRSVNSEILMRLAIRQELPTREFRPDFKGRK